MNENESGDETDFHLPEDISWTMLKQWFKAIFVRLVSLKECMGRDVTDMVHPRNYWHHNQACQEYLNQLKKVQREIEVAIDLSRGTYFDEDSIRIKKSNTRFTRFQLYHHDERSSTTTDTRNRILPDRPEYTSETTDSA